MFNEREVGRLLGFPECCIHQFCIDEVMSAATRGAVYFFRENGTIAYYVPCYECVEERSFMGGIYFGPGDTRDAMLQLENSSQYVDDNMQVFISPPLRISYGDVYTSFVNPLYKPDEPTALGRKLECMK